MNNIKIMIGAAMVLAAVVAWAIVRPAENPCADAKQTGMGRSYDNAPGGNYFLKWDKTCPSGVRWMAQ